MLAAFDAAEAAIAPVYSMHDLMADPHVSARGVFVRSTVSSCRDRSRGSLRTPGEVRFVGRALGADTDAVLDEL